MMLLSLRSFVLSALFLVIASAFTPPNMSATVRAREPQPGQDKDPALQAAAAMYEGIRTEILPNGLKVYLKPIPGSPVVTTIVAYKVGSSDEDLEHTGLSHYLEHLMFKGTAKIMPGDIDRVTMRNGGANNAYTSEDYTVYHFDFAADRWAAALEIEADRMRTLQIDAKHEFEQEKGAVIAELERNEDEPWDLESKMILPLLFDVGPLGHPVIGERQHVRGASAAVIKAHYDKWYYPNNASLVICGGFEPETALAKIKQLFGPLPSGDLPPRKPAPDFKRTGPIVKDMPSKFDVPRMIFGYNTVKSGDPDFYALEVVQGLLTNGKTGRLYKKLVEETEVASAVSSADYAGRYPGWFTIQVQLLQGKDPKKTEQLVLAELKQLAEKPVDPAELKRVKKGLVAAAIFGRESVHNLADSIARGVTTNDLDFLKSYLPRIQAVTAQEVLEVFRKYFDPDRRVLVTSIPQKAAGAAPQGASPSARPVQRMVRTRRQAGVSDFPLKEAQQVVLPNGLTLLLFENHRLPILVADARVRWVNLVEPAAYAGVASLVGSMLDEGTTRHTSRQIAEMIEDVGGVLSFSSSGGSVKVLTPDSNLGLGLLFECLSSANFPQEEFARKQAQHLSNIADLERQPEARARLLYRRLVYGTHPFARPSIGRAKTVQALKAADCQAFYHQVFVPSNTVVAVVGDFDSKQIIAEVARLTADWKGNSVKRPATPAVEKPKEFVERFVTVANAAQLHFFMGHVGVRRETPDFYKLLVMDYVLGLGPGFTDRLSARLRDREGLAYSVSANITTSASEEPGLFTCYIGTNPDALGKVKNIFLEEQPQDEEVEDAKKYLLGSLPFDFTTDERVAIQLLMIERYKLGFGYLDDFRKAVQAVTAADIHEMAQKYLDPDHMILVAVGAIDKAGKPLATSKK
jgi:zinc protease